MKEVFIILSILFLLAALFAKPKIENGAIIADKIKACFDGVDLSSESFTLYGEQIKGSRGDTLFYRKIEVDRGIECLNNLITDMRVNAKPGGGK